MSEQQSNHPHACCYWLTGLPGAGKTTLATFTKHALEQQGIKAVVLDGDHLRKGLNRDLGFSREDRGENIRRMSEVARLMAEFGIVALVSAISPYREDRQMARELFNAGDFFEVYVATDLDTCVSRDPKGLYARAKAGELKFLTGWDAPYEQPEQPELLLQTAGATVEETADILVQHILKTMSNRTV